MKITFVLPTYPLVPIGGFRVVYEYANAYNRNLCYVFHVFLSQEKRNKNFKDMNYKRNKVKFYEYQ